MSIAASFNMVLTILDATCLKRHGAVSGQNYQSLTKLLLDQDQVDITSQLIRLHCDRRFSSPNFTALYLSVVILREVHFYISFLIVLFALLIQKDRGFWAL